jgi:ATP adenylyltransferase
MKNLWTPWRMEYIQQHDSTGQGCIFEAGAGKTHEKESLLLYRDDLVVVLLNRFPYANGHLLVAPCRHIGDISELEPEEDLGLFNMVRNAVAVLRQHLQPDGFNVGLNLGTVAGAGHPEHLHFHVVPRWEGDHNFMTVFAEVRTIPEHIDRTFDLLLSDFQALLDKKV